MMPRCHGVSMMPRRHELISDDYLAQQKVLHMLPEGYGGRGVKWAETVQWLCEHFGCNSVLDYGCGQGSLARAVASKTIDVREYDPAISAKEALPSFADLVVCTDVLEHVEPERLSAVISHLSLLARKAILLVVNLRPSNKTLTDGRNAHLILESPLWWQNQIEIAGLQVCDLPNLPVPSRLLRQEKREKFWIGVVTR